MGRIIIMDHYAAMKACQQGTHVPTARELAMDAHLRGAKGILEVSQVNPHSHPDGPDGYTKISVINPDGKKDEFYYSGEGYNRPYPSGEPPGQDVDMVGTLIYSSSVTQGGGRFDVYVFGSHWGEFSLVPRDFADDRVRCFQGASVTPPAPDVLGDVDGRPRYMDQVHALHACPAGTHLPSIRELAIDAQSRGAKGILEVSQVNPQSIPAGYELISASAATPDHKKDEFYYSNEGYHAPLASYLEKHWLVSSSGYAGFPSCYIFDTDSAEINGYGDTEVPADDANQIYTTARCFPNR